MKRTTVLPAAILALVLAACGSEQAIESPTPAATPTEVPTAEPTPSPTTSQAAEPTDDGSGSGLTGSLTDLLPDQIGGLERTEIPGMEEMIGPMLSQQGLDADEADFAWAVYGEGELIVTGFAVPGMPQGQLETFARLMSGMQVEGAEDLETETANVGGKEVLRMTVAGETQSVLMYIADGAVFTIVAESEDLAAELLAELP